MFRATLVRSTILSFILISGSLSVTYAQQRFSAGPRIGLNMSTFGRDASGYTLRPGVTAGAFLMYSSLNHFGISGDILYSQMGAKFSQNNESFKQRINYLEIPVALRYFLTLSGNFRPNLFFGPSLGIKLNAKNTKYTNTNPLITRSDFDNSNDFNNLDLGLIAGFSLISKDWPNGSTS